MIPKKTTIRDFAEAFRAGSLTSAEAVADALARAKHDPFNCFITLNDRAKQDAVSTDKRLADGEKGELLGVPIAVKDVLMTEGMRTTAASNILREYVAPYTATAVKRLEEAGMIVIGKTNCDEFAMGSSNENSAFGPVANPHDPTRVAGGSSGGSAAAVAAGYAPVALGTDTGGSVRLPASFCGVIGLKPTYGRVSRYGLIAMASSLDQIGVFSHSAFDAALILKSIAGHDPMDATSSMQPVDDYPSRTLAPLSKLTIGIPREYHVAGVDIADELIDRARSALKSVSEVTLVNISLPHTAYALAVYYICMSSEVSANLARYDGIRYGYTEGAAAALDEVYRRSRAVGFGAEVRRRILLGTYSLSAGYFDAYYNQAAKVRTCIRRDFDDAFKEVDVILAPTSPTPAFKLGEKSSDPLLMYLSDIYMVSANLAGIPAVSFPAGTVENLPAGLQLMGPAWSEAALLNAVHGLMPRFVRA